MGIINVYAPQEENSRVELWKEITDLILEDRQRGWIICGDVNEVRNVDERSGSIFSIRGAHHFNNFINDLGLLDLNLGGGTLLG